MKKHAWKIAVAGVVVLSIAFLAYRSLSKADTQTAQTRSVTVEVGDVRPSITVTGYISAASQTLVNFDTSGKLVEVYVKPGDVVEPGAKLGRIDPTELGRQVDQAKANLEMAKIKRDQALASDAANVQSNQISVDAAKRALDQAQARLDELKTKYPTPNDSQQQQIDQQQSQADQANANYQQALVRLQSAKDSSYYNSQLQNIQVEQARQALDDAHKDYDSAVLKAPVGGTIVAVNYSVGDQVPGSSTASLSARQASSATAGTGGTSSSASSASTSGSAFVVIGDPSKLQVTLTIDQSDIANVKVGMPVEITADAVQNKTYKGKITSIDPTPVTSQGVTTFTVYASIENPDSSLLQGMSVTAKIDQGVRRNVLVVPNMAVRSSRNGKVVRKVVDGQPTDVSVIIGASDEEYTEIKSGLMKGDRIVVDVFQYTGASQGSATGFPGMGFGGGAMRVQVEGRSRAY